MKLVVDVGVVGGCILSGGGCIIGGWVYNWWAGVQSTLGKKGANPLHVATAMKNLGMIRKGEQWNRIQTA